MWLHSSSFFLHPMFYRLSGVAILPVHCYTSSQVTCRCPASRNAFLFLAIPMDQPTGVNCPTSDKDNSHVCLSLTKRTQIRQLPVREME